MIIDAIEFVYQKPRRCVTGLLTMTSLRDWERGVCYFYNPVIPTGFYLSTLNGVTSGSMTSSNSRAARCPLKMA